MDFCKHINFVGFLYFSYFCLKTLKHDLHIYIYIFFFKLIIYQVVTCKSFCKWFVNCKRV